MDKVLDEQEQLVPLILKLFVNRPDIWAEQQPDGRYITRREPLDEKLVRKHLRGEVTAGTYPINPEDQTTKFLAFDIDGQNAELVETAIKRLYEQVVKEIPEKAVLLEKSRRGYHLWVFFSPPVPATFANQFGIELARKTKIGDKEIPVSTKEEDLHVEIFPKQGFASKESPGNQIKLPLGIHKLSRKRTEFIANDLKTVLDPLVALQSVSPWSPPESLVPSYAQPRAPAKLEPILVGDFPCWTKISAGDIPEGARHLTALALACHLRDKGIAEGLARTIMREWWGRLPQPPRATSTYPWEDAERCLIDAYRKGYWVGCKRIRALWPQLCDPSCPALTGKAKPTGVRLYNYLESEATDRIELLEGRFVLECHGSHTVLYNPETRQMIGERGRYEGWSPWVWRGFIEEVRRSFGEEVARELRKTAEKFIGGWVVREELEVVDDDSPSIPTFFGQHALKANFSRQNNYIRISGQTFRLAERLRKDLRAQWNPDLKVWELPYSDNNLKKVKAFLKQYDKVVPRPVEEVVREVIG
jgi:hypothetical protein